MHKTTNVVQCGAAFEFIGVSGDAYLGLAAWVWHQLYQPHSVSSHPPPIKCGNRSNLQWNLNIQCGFGLKPEYPQHKNGNTNWCLFFFDIYKAVVLSHSL